MDVDAELVISWVIVGVIALFMVALFCMFVCVSKTSAEDELVESGLWVGQRAGTNTVSVAQTVEEGRRVGVNHSQKIKRIITKKFPILLVICST